MGRYFRWYNLSSKNKCCFFGLKNPWEGGWRFSPHYCSYSERINIPLFGNTIRSGCGRRTFISLCGAPGGQGKRKVIPNYKLIWMFTYMWIGKVDIPQFNDKLPHQYWHFSKSIGWHRSVILLMEEILHQLRLAACLPLFTGFYTSQVVVWDFWTINRRSDLACNPWGPQNDIIKYFSEIFVT